MAYDEAEDAESPLLERAKRCLKLCQEAEARQRQREQEDLRFQVPEFQWDDAARRQRAGDTVNGVPTPARPILSISKIDQPIQLILNQARAARLGVNIHPVSEDANKDGAELRQGLYRRIERDSHADQARLWALERATKAGRGVYRITTEYDEDSDPGGPGAFDQEIRIKRILHQESVYFDPAAVEADFSDASWVLATAWLDEAQFKAEFGDQFEGEDPSDDLEWGNLLVSAPDWVRVDEGQRSWLVAEYWYKDTQVQKIKNPNGGEPRKKESVVVKIAKICASKVLSENAWAGRYIPFVQVVGRELIPFDSERRWVGMIGPAKDGQRFYNYAASTFVERLALEPKVPFIGAEGQFEGHESEWQQINTRNMPYVEYVPKSLNDTPLGPPTRSQVDQGGMSLAMQAMQEADRFIQTTTAVYDPSLGRDNPRDKSGKAILALQQQSDAGTSQYLNSLADVAMAYEAKIVLDLMPKIYDRPGRVTTVVRGDDDEAEHVMLNQPFTKDPNGGPPQPVPPGMPPMPGQPPQPLPKGAKEYDLSKGKYSISVDVGKSFQTRLQAGQEAMSNIVSTAPEMMFVMGDLLFRFQDFPGSTEVADRMKKVIAQKNPSLLDQNDPGQQAQAELAAAKGQMEQMGQQMQEMQKALETDQVKAQADVEKEKIRAQVEMAKAELDSKAQEGKNATAIAVAEINARAKGVLSQMEAEHEALATGLKQAHELGMARHDTAHDVAMAAVGHQNAQAAAAEQAAMATPAGEAPVAPEPIPAEPPA